MVPYEEILRLEETARVVRAATMVGIRKVRLTGGEPLVRKGMGRLVELLTDIPEITDLALTTNGVMFAEFAAELKAAGLKRINVSMDTLRPERYTWISRGGELKRVWQGIEAALAQGFHPVKLNTVVVKGFNDDEITDLARLTIDVPLHVRFIELMPFGPAKEWAKGGFMSTAQTQERVEASLGPLLLAKKPAGGGPARYYTLPGAQGTVGFISGMSGHICSRCNRLRLTSAGKLRPCLFGEEEIDLKGPLRAGADLSELASIMAAAIKSKAEKKAAPGCPNVMARIGG
jgi:cyclic pyranopterin phosphate synthase